MTQQIAAHIQPAKKQNILFFYGLNATVSILLIQLIQRFFPVVDNHYIGMLGEQALLIHNIYYTFLSIAQYASYAAVTSCLILWKADAPDHNNTIFSAFLTLSMLSSVICMLPVLLFMPEIIAHFGVQPGNIDVCEKYLMTGLLSVIAFTLFYYITGANNGTKKYHLSLIFTCLLLGMMILANTIGTHYVHFPHQPMIFIITIKFILMTILVAMLLQRSTGKLNLSSVFKLQKSDYRIWLSELASGIVMAIYPIIFAFQLAIIDKHNSLIISYQLILQLSTLLCIPLMCSIQANLAQGSACNGRIREQTWWRNILVTGLAPTMALLLCSLFYNKGLMRLVFNYNLPDWHESYVFLFIIATMIGQIGNALIAILRARKKSHLVTVIFYVSDIVFLLGTTQIFILAQWKSPLMVGVATVVYTVAYTAMAVGFCLKKSR